MEKPGLIDLADSDLSDLRLGAEVMAHRAKLDEQPGAARYFLRLEEAARREIRARAGDTSRTDGMSALLPEAAAGRDERGQVTQYLGLLIANERLSPALRGFCRALRDRDSRAGEGR